jgi:hypothetical protein
MNILIVIRTSLSATVLVGIGLAKDVIVTKKSGEITRVNKRWLLRGYGLRR